MSIKDENTVLILGAGVSVPFNMPTGGKFIDYLSNSISAELKELKIINPKRVSYRRNMLHEAIVGNQKNFSKFPICAALSKEFYDEKKSTLELTDEFRLALDKMDKLQGLLSDQTSDTIDDFIVENPSYSRLAKFGIAAKFMESCYELDLDSRAVKNLAQRNYDFIAKDKKEKRVEHRNWIHLLINLIRHGLRAETVSKDNKIRIITFNYDMILEFVLDKQFSNTELNRGHYTDFIEIVHVHGQCGPLEDILVDPTQTCVDWADGIFVVGEDEPSEGVKKSRKRAKELIQGAKEIYACGFAFSGPNCRLLGLDNLDNIGTDRTISFCNYDGNVGLSKAVKKFEKTVETSGYNTLASSWVFVEEAEGTKDQPIEVVDWLRLGYLGELPA